MQTDNPPIFLDQSCIFYFLEQCIYTGLCIQVTSNIFASIQGPLRPVCTTSSGGLLLLKVIQSCLQLTTQCKKKTTCLEMIKIVKTGLIKEQGVLDADLDV